MPRHCHPCTPSPIHPLWLSSHLFLVYASCLFYKNKQTRAYFLISEKSSSWFNTRTELLRPAGLSGEAASPHRAWGWPVHGGPRRKCSQGLRLPGPSHPVRVCTPSPWRPQSHVSYVRPLLGKERTPGRPSGLDTQYHATSCLPPRIHLEPPKVLRCPPHLCRYPNSPLECPSRRENGTVSRCFL